MTGEVRSRGEKGSGKTSLVRNLSHRIRRFGKRAAMQEEGIHSRTVDADHRPSNRYSDRASFGRPDPRHSLLSDGENERTNSNIERLVTAIDDGRLIHFEPNTVTGEVEISANTYSEVIRHEVQEEDELERDIAASPENIGRITSIGDGDRHMQSLNSLQSAHSTDSWVSTDSEEALSNAWGKAAAAADTRFAQECGKVENELNAIEKPLRSPKRDIRVQCGRRLVRTTSPILLDYHKPLRMSTPSIHSNETRQDTSSPLFGKSCERILRQAYAEPPQSSFHREYDKNSQLGRSTNITEPRDLTSLGEVVRDARKGIGRSFGVFKDRPDGESSSDQFGTSVLRSKVLKDVSNLRRPGYLQFNSFAKDEGSAGDHSKRTARIAATSSNFGGSSNAKLRRAYINKRWPGLLSHRNNGSMTKSPRFDGVARRRNEQAVGHPIDKSLYALSHTAASGPESSLQIDSNRQAHFDLALARLEGRALPPPPSPITRCPDWAALYDCDIDIEGVSRPLSLHEPAPSRRPRRLIWRYFR